MKINLNPIRILLWFVTAIIVFGIFMFFVFFVFFVSGLLMAIFRVRDDVVLTVHAFLSLPLSLLFTLWFMVVKRDILASFIDANAGR